MKIPVLDKGWVELQDMMGSDLAIVNAARVSYLGESKGEEEDRRLLNYLMQHEHGTPFEMAVFKFRVKAPEIVFRQWVRHRIGSFNVQSRRYTEVEENDFYMPKVWRLQDEINRQGSSGALDTEAGQALSSVLADTYAVCLARYEQALAQGVAREQARLFLPGFAVYSAFMWTVNARSLMNFLKQRLDEHAQWEIRQYAKVVWQIFKAKLPWTAIAFRENEMIEDESAILLWRQMSALEVHNHENIVYRIGAFIDTFVPCKVCGEWPHGISLGHEYEAETDKRKVIEAAREIFARGLAEDGISLADTIEVIEMYFEEGDND